MTYWDLYISFWISFQQFKNDVRLKYSLNVRMTLKDKVSIKRSSTFGLKSGNICHKLMKIALGKALPAIIYHCFLLFCAINGMKKMLVCYAKYIL